MGPGGNKLPQRLVSTWTRFQFDWAVACLLAFNALPQSLISATQLCQRLQQFHGQSEEQQTLLSRMTDARGNHREDVNQSPKPWSDSIIYIYWRRHARRWRTSHVCAFILFGGGTIAQARRRLDGVVSILCWIDCDLHNQIYRSWSWPRTCMNMQQQWEENLLMQTSKTANQTTTEQ